MQSAAVVQWLMLLLCHIEKLNSPCEVELIKQTNTRQNRKETPRNDDVDDDDDSRNCQEAHSKAITS